MKIALLCGKYSTGLHGQIDAENLFEGRPLTGSESSFFNVAKGLAELGNEVNVYCDVAKPVEKSDKLAGASIYHIDNDPPYDYDAYISLNEPDQFRRLPKDIRGLRIVQMQLNDFPYCQPGFEEYADIYAFLSPVQRKHILSVTPVIDEKKAHWLPNSINLEISEPYKNLPKIPHSMIWCSSPDRGLHRILEIFPDIRNQIPDATLKIFYRFDPWYLGHKDHNSQVGARARFIGECLERLGRNGENGVHFIGPISNVLLAKELAQTEILPYTCDCMSFTEGFSVSIMDACRAGCVPIISDTDAIGDIYKNVAYVIRGKVHDRKQEWIDTIVRTMNDPKLRKAISTRARNFAQRFSRQHVSRLWEILIKENLGKKSNFTFHPALPATVQEYAIPTGPSSEARLYSQNDPTEIIVEQTSTTPTLKAHAPIAIQEATQETTQVDTPPDEKPQQASVLPPSDPTADMLEEADNFIRVAKESGQVIAPFYVAPVIRQLIENAGFDVLSRTYGKRPEEPRGKALITSDGGPRGTKYRYWYEPQIAETDLEAHQDGIEEKWWDIHKDDVVLDIGAEFGSYTVPALAKGAAHVFAWSPSNARNVLVKSVEINDWQERCTVIPGGLWSAAGHLSLTFPEMPTYHSENPPKERMNIPVETLDEFFSEHKTKKIDIIKIDAEGAEVEILKGARKTILEHHPRLILIENHHYLKLSLVDETRAIMSSYGYEEIEHEHITPFISHSKYEPKGAHPKVHKNSINPRVTVMLGSSRPGGLDITLAGLTQQKYQDFEVVFVDARYHERHDKVLEAVKLSGLKQPFYHVPNHRYSDSIWGTTCAGYNTGFMLADGKYVIMLLDYAYTPPVWLENHVKHLEQDKIVMGPHQYLLPRNVMTKNNELLIDFINLTTFQNRPTNEILDLILEQRTKFGDQISIFEKPFDPRHLQFYPAEEWQELKCKMNTGPGTWEAFNTKNESFPLDGILEINGMDENFDRGSGPGDPDLGFRLAMLNLPTWIVKEAIVYCLNPRRILPNLNLVLQGKKIPPPHDKRWTFAEGQLYFERMQAKKDKRAPNPYDLTQKRKEIWHWREESQKLETTIPKNVVSDQDYFPESSP